MREVAKIKEILSSPKKIAIITHHKPDADALGSSIGLSLFLKKLGHQTHVVTPSDYPKFLTWMPENELVLAFSEHSAKECENTLKNAELIFCLDFNDPKRVNDLEDALTSSKAQKILVDHHLEPVNFADIYYQDSSSAATCELIYEMIDEMGFKNLIDIGIGECLYAGIMTDTGSFRFSSTTYKVHIIIAELLKIGVNNTKVHRLIYDNNTENRLRFLGFSLYNKLEILREFKTAFFCITDDELKQFNSQTGDTEGLVNYALSLEGIVMAVVMIERDDMVKISFRSAGNFSVRDFAFKHFEGGGHKNASGGKSYESLEDTKKKLLNLLPLYKNELNNTTENN
ncbi:MAG: bifunctional oligoribonuclease/PAP phosphatase NrnA [Cytophagales bacterium]